MHTQILIDVFERRVEFVGQVIWHNKITGFQVKLVAHRQEVLVFAPLEYGINVQFT